MTKESLNVILAILNQTSISVNNPNGLEFASAIFKAKAEVEEELKK